MSIVADALIDKLLELPTEDRVPVLKSILISADPKAERWVQQKAVHLQEQGYEARDALSEAFAQVLHGPMGGKIIDVMASGAARGAVEMGVATNIDAHALAQNYSRVLSKAEQRDTGRDEGLGIAGTIIAAATAVISILTNVIGAAVRKVRARRAALARRLTPLNDNEIQEIVAATLVRGGRPRAYREAEGDILSLIAELREGRTSYLLDPTTGDNIGSTVNERQAIVAVYAEQRRVAVAQLRAAQTQQRIIYGGVAVVVAAAVTGAVVYATGPKKDKKKDKK